MKRPHAGPPTKPHRGGQRRRRRLTAASAALLALLGAAPAAHAAKPRALHVVVVHLRAADRALNRLVEHPAGPLAAMYLTRTTTQTALAAQGARSIFPHGQASSQRSATVLGLLADHQTSDAQALTSILGQVRPELQAQVAQAISAATGGRGVVLEKMSGLLGALATDAQPIVAQVIAIESSQGAQVPDQLAGVLGANGLACQAAGAVQQALVVATQAFEFDLSNLGPALALVPAPVRQQVQAEIDGVPALLRHIEEQLAQVVPCVGSTRPSAAVAAPAPLKTPALLSGMTQLIDQILGRLLPGLATGQPPAPLPAPAPLTQLLVGLTGLFGGQGRLP